MKLLRFVCIVVLLTLCLPARQSDWHKPSLPEPAATLSQPDAKTRARLNKSFGQLPLSFEANQGQADSAVRFLARGNGYQLKLKPMEAELIMRKAEGGRMKDERESRTNSSPIPHPSSFTALRMKFVNANPAPQMAGRAELPGKSHYYIGNDPKNWRTNVASYAQVEYQQVWPGIDLVYYGNQRRLEYDFIIAPGAQPDTISFTFDGADKVELDAQGNLVLQVAGGEVVMQKPFVYQEVNGTRHEIAGSYQIQNPKSKIQNQLVGFRVGDYDASLPLVIDPVLVYSTYLGPASRDIANDIAVDQAGNVYITGASFFSSEGWNAFVAKLNAAGTTLLYSTAFIGSRDEIGFGVAVDAAGNAYATGFTRSTNFPVRNAYQPRLGATDCRNANGCPDAFVVKLDAAGAIAYSTYLGGNDNPGDISAFGDLGYDIAVDGSGQAYVVGSTISRNFPVKNAYQPAGNVGVGNAVNDCFITKFNAAGSDLVYSTYLGGNGIDVCHGIALDAAGNAYVTGQTNRVFNDVVNSFPTTANAFQPTPAPDLQDGFVTKLNAAGNALMYSTYLGGNNSDQGEAIAVDPAGNAYVIGATSSTNFPLDGAHQAVNLGGSAFVTKLNPSGSGLLYSTYLGKQVWPRTGTSPGAAIAVDAAGIAYIIGSTSAADFPVVNALYPTFGGGPRDAYIAKINTVTKTVLYATYLGGSLTDYGYGIALDAAGNVYVTGETNSANFPLKNPLQPTLGSSDFNSDTYVTKIGEDSGPCQTLDLQAADAEQAQDTLQIAEAQPRNDAPISGALLKIGGLKVTVRYLLQSRANATLAVRLIDEDGNQRGDAGEFGIARPMSCPNPLPTHEFNFSSASIDFTPKIGGEVPTKVTLLALMLDPATGSVLKFAELSYRVIPDLVAFESNPTINGKAAPDGSTFPEDGKIKFDCGLRYHLTNDVRGKLRLEAFNFTGQSIARKDFAATVPATAQPVTVGFALDFEFTVPPTASQITIAAYLLAENGTELKISVPLTYRSSGFGIALGALAPDTSQFRPFQGAQPVLVAGERVKPAFGLSEDRSLVLGVTEDLTSLPTNTVSALLLSERMADGTPVREDQFLARTKITGLPRPTWYITLPSAAPGDADLWELKLVFFPPGKDPLFSKPLRLNIDRVRVVPKQFIPPLTAELQRGKPEKILCKLEYNVNRSGASQVFAHIEYNSLSGEPPPPPIKLLDLRTGNHSPADPPFSEFNVPVPDNAKVTVVRIYFSLSNTTDARRAISPPIEYRDFTKELQIPGGITSINTGLGVAASLLQNSTNRAIRVKRQANQFKGLIDSFKLNFGAELEEGANATAPFALRYAEAASLLRDFIGVNAYWGFDPPIPADGSFVADLIFTYDAEMLPDDPNFSEATLKIASFDPDSGQLVSYPTTVNTTAKTATARVNSLARYYTLGVFGPFAQRSLNFPVLQSSDDFTTRFNLVNAGTADAALTLRAYDEAGANLQAPNLVNPLTSTLAAARMLMGSFSDLFKSTVPLTGWVQTRANRNTVAGYELLTSGNRFDGLNAPTGYNSALILPEAFYDATQTTEVHLANATNFSGVVTLELHDSAGRLTNSAEVTLPPKGRFAQRLPGIFQNLAQPFTGYLLILSERDLAAAAVQVLEKEITALNAQPLGSGATKLYAPYLSLGGPTTARLTLVNPTAQTANLTLRLINKPGAIVGAPVNLTLGAGEQLQRNFSQLFDLNPLSLTYSTLIVESETAGLAGNITLFNPSSAIPFRATVPLERAPANRLIFAHLNTSDGYYTELGIFNPSAQAARVTLACFKPDGTSLGQSSFNLPANTVFGNFLDAQVSEARGQAAGYFTLTSDQPILAGAAFGTDAGSALAALPPQILPTTNTNALATVSAASFQGQTFAPDSIVSAFGLNLSNSIVVANQVPLPATLADTIVEVRDSLGVTHLAPLFFVSPGQINYLLPPGIANGTATVTVTNGGGGIATGTIQIDAVSPGLFTFTADGQGVPAAVVRRFRNNQELPSVLAAQQDAQGRWVPFPIDLGPDTDLVLLEMFGTGLRFRSSLSAVSVKIGGAEAQIFYAGLTPGLVGLDQVDFVIPRSLLGRGDVNIVLTVDGRTANMAKVNIK